MNKPTSQNLPLSDAESKLNEAVYVFGLWQTAHRTQCRDDLIIALFWTDLFLGRMKGKKRKLHLDLKAYNTEMLFEEMERRKLSLESYPGLRSHQHLKQQLEIELDSSSFRFNMVKKVIKNNEDLLDVLRQCHAEIEYARKPERMPSSTTTAEVLETILEKASDYLVHHIGRAEEIMDGYSSVRRKKKKKKGLHND